jgi:phage gpG-like protein
MSMINIAIDDQLLRQAISSLDSGAHNLAPAMRKIAQTLATETENNFRAEGRPKWQALAESTVHSRLGGAKAYRKDGKLKASAQRIKDGGFRILQHTGALASSITTDSDSNHAVIGSNKVYAAIHQFGGDAGRGKKVSIPARPFLPITEDGKLQPEAEQAVLETVLYHLQTAAGI